MATLYSGIESLVTNDLALDKGILGELEQAAFIEQDGQIVWLGESKDAPDADNEVNLEGKSVIPGFVDSHAHLVFAGERAKEFEARMSGKKYSASGIMTTVHATRAASDEQLDENIATRAIEMYRSGITTFETKSGYGLNVADELRSVRLAVQHTEDVTFMGAHVVPEEFKNRRDEYVSLVMGEMLEACAPYSRWIDVFCDQGAFDYEESKAILEAGIAQGLLPRIHANQLAQGRGVELAVELGCASADHCTHLSSKDLELLASSNTVATLLPGAEFSTRAEYPDAKRLWDAGVSVALATDCNPGSSYTTSMPFCIAVAVRDMHFTPEQALWSATMGGAKALQREDVGMLAVGKSADFVILDAPSFRHIAYRPGVDLIQETVISGTSIYRSNK
ncbi:MAG: imidazolonepropionase [Actinobacteria bacterium]|uniref:imidazolonepropionase n=1 Tax=freshwater metagenome TaxID=449393 RepID=A0A6J6NKD2_9ZZZZ|nr:imidazolonepropionase [Actinomycetota bacterium]